jgi:hypothetical protein
MRSEAMEFEIDDIDVLFDASTNPSLVHRPSAQRSRHALLSSWNRKTRRQRAVDFPEEDEKLI